MFPYLRHYGYWREPKIINPEPWRSVAGRKQPQPQLHRKRVNISRKTKRQGRNG